MIEFPVLTVAVAPVSASPLSPKESLIWQVLFLASVKEKGTVVYTEVVLAHVPSHVLSTSGTAAHLMGRNKNLLTAVNTPRSRSNLAS